MENIYYKTYPAPDQARFSILIPTWNNLKYLQLCVDSIRKHSRFAHEIIIHVNEGADGTREWVEAQGFSYTFTPRNAGICYAMNAMATHAGTEHLFYLNDDMVVCPDWDFHLWREMERLDHIYFLLGSALIEPNDTGHPCMIYRDEFGDSLETFNEALLLEKYMSFPKEDWQGAGGSAVVIPKKLWGIVGGYSVEMSPGMYSDVDFNMKLWHAGVRLFKGVSKSRIYHFKRRSTGRVFQKNDGRKQFREKWKIPSSQFNKLYLRLGEPFDGPLQPPRENWWLKWTRFRSRWM